MCAILLARFLSVSLFVAAPATVLDVHDRPLDRMTFINPWVNGQFEISRNGGQPYCTCGSNDLRGEGDPWSTEMCQVSFDLIVLDGAFTERSGAESAWAIWSAEYQTPLRNGWRFEGVEGDDKLLAGVTRHKSGKSLALGAFPFSGVVEMFGALGSKHQMTPMVCEQKEFN